MKTQSQIEAQRRYRKKVKRILVEFYPTESDLIEHLEQQEKKQTYIKDLIRMDLEKQKKAGH